MKTTNKNKIKIPLVAPNKEIVTSVIFPFFLVFLLTVIVFVAGSKLAKNIKTKPQKKSSLVMKGNVSKSKVKESLETVKSTYLDPVKLIDTIKSDPEGIVIIDTRSKEEYKRAHVKGAFNLSLEDLKGDIKKLKGKQIVIYGRTTSDEAPMDAAVFILGKGFDVRILSVGWNEFRHFRNLWLPESLWGKVDVEQYISAE